MEQIREQTNHCQEHVSQYCNQLNRYRISFLHHALIEFVIVLNTLCPVLGARKDCDGLTLDVNSASQSCLLTALSGTGGRTDMAEIRKVTL